MNTKLWERAISVRIVILPVFYYNGEAYFVTKNAQQDVIAIRNASGAIVVQYYYDAWGNPTAFISASSEYEELGRLNPIRYRGYIYDEETGNYFLNARYYDPEIGRFISADSTEVPTVTPGNTKWDKNLYAYCDNNPVSRVDDQGQCWDILIGAAVGGAIGVGSTLINNYIMGEETTTADIVGAFTAGAVNGALSFNLFSRAATTAISFITSGLSAWASGSSVNEILLTASTAAVASFISGGMNKGLPVYKMMSNADKTMVIGANFVSSTHTETVATMGRAIYKAVSSIPKPKPLTSSQHGGGKYTYKVMAK